MASAMRDSSPPEATLASGRGVLPAWPATRNSADSSAERLRRVAARPARPRSGRRPCRAAASPASPRRRTCGAAVRARRARRGAPRRRRRRAPRRPRARARRGRRRRRARAARPATAPAAPAGRPAGGDSAAPALIQADRRSSSSRRRCRVELGAVEVAGERVRRVLQLRLRALQRLDRRRRAARRMRRRPASASMARPASASAFASASAIASSARARGVEQRLAVREAAVLGVELGPFVGAGRELVDLADLPGEPLALALEVALLRARGGERLRRRAPRRPARGERRGVDPRVRVEQGAHRGRARQALPGVLAVDVDQVVGRLAQLRDRRGAAVDPRAALALRVDRRGAAAAAGVAGVGVEAGVGEPARRAPAARRTRR